LKQSRSAGKGWDALEGLVAPTLLQAAPTRLVRVPAIELATGAGEIRSTRGALSADRAWPIQDAELREDLGGSQRVLRVRNLEVAVIRSELRRVLSGVTDMPVDGLIGYSFLRRSRVVIDYPRGVVWLDPMPVATDDRPFEHSHVGLQIERHDGVMRIVGVAARSPAAQAGIRPGDRIIRVDGESAAQLDAITLAHRLEGPPGTAITLVIRSDKGERTYRLRRRRLL
jgi:hypothetical protein